jgi:hypothetical protein
MFTANEVLSLNLSIKPKFNFMDALFNVLIAVLPSAIVFLTAFFFLKRMTENEYRKQMIEFKANNQKNVTPLRLQAYERISIFLERIHPTSLVMRNQKAGMSARLLQAELLKNIRSEYEHNVAQQIYMSPAVWSAVKAAKEETVKIVNISAARVGDEATGAELAKMVIDLSGQLEKIPSDFAIDILKKEVKTLF